MATLTPDMKSQVRIIFKHLPSMAHPWAYSAAKASVCAGFQSPEGFWIIHDMFFRNQDQITPAIVRSRAVDFADAMSLDLGGFSECLEGSEADAVIATDVALAKRLNINVTPTLFINGARQNGVPTDLTGLIREALKQR
jgi:protein-disulfide isomerase